MPYVHGVFGKECHGVRTDYDVKKLVSVYEFPHTQPQSGGS